MEISNTLSQPKINQLIYSSETIHLKMHPAILKKNNYVKHHPLTLLLTTSTLSKVLHQLFEIGAIRFDTDSTADLIIKKYMGCPYWDLNFISYYDIDTLRMIIGLQLSICNELKLRGSLPQYFKMGGSFNNGVITLPPQDSTDELMQQLVACDKTEIIIYTPQIVTLDEIRNRNKHETDSIDLGTDNEDTYDSMRSVSTTLSFNRREIKQILGAGGTRLDSIRIQSRCWIHIDSTPYESQQQYIDGNMRFISKNNMRQDITINGLSQNVDIAINEIYNCVLPRLWKERQTV
ncbi:hypothetical protein CANMA_000273 [Candida margitis]|uniref:uncharacterized protein n=1 Tax=Candida margitis TaxID=1775924 RepID=UPI002226D5F7|nr:uncharacterized protein CANMA_000273 [Candida margitis]KAI5970682.1 hypothetical protein CANMA_000273 [Candida margitis]